MGKELEQMLKRKEEILAGDAARVKAQHDAGKLTARERIDKLLGAEFTELDQLTAGGESGVVTGYGVLGETPVYVWAQDYTVKGGAISASGAQKVLKLLDLAKKAGKPVVSLLDSAGMRLDEGVCGLAAFARILGKVAELSGVVPQVALVLGPVMGGSAMVAAQSDVVIQAKCGSLLANGPQIIGSAKGKPYKERKVRLLNGAHTCSVAAAYLAGCRTVLEMMSDPLLGRFVKDAMFEEMAPCVPLPIEEANAFALSVIERFRNPYVKHQLISISLNSFSKWRARLLNTFKDDIARGAFPRRIAFSMAALLAFYTGETEADGYFGTADGEKYRIQDDERVIEAVSSACRLSAREYAHAILTRTDFWGEDLSAVAGFEDSVTGDLERIRTVGMRATLEQIV